MYRFLQWAKLPVWTTWGHWRGPSCPRASCRWHWAGGGRGLRCCRWPGLNKILENLLSLLFDRNHGSVTLMKLGLMKKKSAPKGTTKIWSQTECFLPIELHSPAVNNFNLWHTYIVMSSVIIWHLHLKSEHSEDLSF